SGAASFCSYSTDADMRLGAVYVSPAVSRVAKLACPRMPAHCDIRSGPRPPEHSKKATVAELSRRVRFKPSCGDVPSELNSSSCGLKSYGRDSLTAMSQRFSALLAPRSTLKGPSDGWDARCGEKRAVREPPVQNVWPRIMKDPRRFSRRLCGA